jgi:hypothetical protein
MEAQNNVEIKEAFDFLYLNEKHLTEGQSQLVKSMMRYYRRNKKLSERQMATRFEIKKYNYEK